MNISWSIQRKLILFYFYLIAQTAHCCHQREGAYSERWGVQAGGGRNFCSQASSGLITIPAMLLATFSYFKFDVLKGKFSSGTEF